MKILRDGGVIDRETQDLLQKVLFELEDHKQIPITDDNGAGLMTYIALMLMRFKRKEIAAPMATEIFAEMKEDTLVYNEAIKLIDAIEEVIHMQIPDSERQYLVANLFPILNPDVV